MRFARARFGHYELIDFVAVLIGYILPGEPTLLAFYERLAPFAEPFMALFGRNRLPHRSTLSRFLAALDPASVEGLRSLFQKDWLARKPFPSAGGLFDRRGAEFLVIDVDGTRQAARQRALPQTEALPAPHRRFDQVCAPGYQGRKRGEVVRTRTVILQAHTHQLLGTFGGPGNGDYRDLAERHLGTIYEGLLEFHLELDSSPEDGWTIDLKTEKGERKATGSYYTPDYIVKYIVEETLGPVLHKAVANATTEAEKAAAVLSVKVLDPAMGSGHFPVEATDYIARFLVESIDRPIPNTSGETDLAYWRRRVVQSCIYGVDLNPLAVELAKLSLWLATR